jgi:hypothetical protein
VYEREKRKREQRERGGRKRKTGGGTPTLIRAGDVSHEDDVDGDNVDNSYLKF